MSFFFPHHQYIDENGTSVLPMLAQEANNYSRDAGVSLHS